MQYVQRCEQPSCTLTTARARRKAAMENGGKAAPSLASSFFIVAPSPKGPASSKALRACGTTASTSGMAASCASSTWAAQPVTTMRAAGFCWRRRRTRARRSLTARLVTAQEFTSSTSASRAFSASA